MTRRFLLIFLLAAPGITALAQTAVVQSDLSIPTKIAPAYFGPNAFPVPEVSDGRSDDKLCVEFAGDYFKGSVADGQDHTWDVFARIRVPLWTPRVSLELWMPVVEWWSFSREVALSRRMVSAESDTRPTWKGHDSGDVYVATNIHVLRGDRGWWPDILVRAVLKTASGNSYGQARYYDGPGYYFDATIAKGKTFQNGFVREIRGAVSGGFLCWQTDNGRQNDAVMYGARADLDTKAFKLTADFAGNVGWDRDGDAPMRLRLRLDGHIGKSGFSPFFQFSYGFMDWPFAAYRLGLSWQMPILK